MPEEGLSGRLIRLGLLLIPNTYNYGSMMMAENTVYYLNKTLSGITFFCDASTNKDLQRLRDATDVKNIVRLPDTHLPGIKKGSLKKVLWHFNWYFAQKVKLNQLKDTSLNYIVVLGGDNILETKSTAGILRRFYEIRTLKRTHLHIFLIGQTMGQFKSWKQCLAKKILNSNRVSIFTRDPISYRYLVNKLNLTNVLECQDLAFLALAKQASGDRDDLLNRYGLEIDHYITFVPSGLWKKYHHDYSQYIATMANITETILKMCRNIKCKLVLLSHVLKPDYTDDRVVIADICRTIENNETDVIPIVDELLPYQARAILGNGLLTITGRMHAAISTFEMGRPAICLSYSIKFAGVIGQGLGREDLIVEANDEVLFENDRLRSVVQTKMQYVFDNYEKILKEIGEQVQGAKNKAILQLDEIARVISETQS